MCISIHKFVEALSTDVILACKLGIAEPVSFEDATAVGLIAAEAALLDEWEVEPSLAVYDQLNAGGVDSLDVCAEFVVSAVVAIDSLAISICFVPDFADVMELGGSIALDEVLLEADRPLWRSL